MNWQRGILRLMGVANHAAQVTQVQDFTPWYRRVTFSTGDWIREVDVFPTLWLRLWVPDTVRAASALTQRGYTFVEVNAETGQFSLDFVLHASAGPAGDWAKQAQVGTHVEVALTPARVTVPAQTQRAILAGDATALPAINSWLATLPEYVEVEVHIEEEHSDVQLLPTANRPHTHWEWIPRIGGRGEALAHSLRTLGPADPTLYIWVAGEKELVKRVRTVIRDDYQLDRGQYFSQFYWIER